MKKTLVIYFSLSGTTKAAAESIQKNTNADIVRIEPVEPYPAGYSNYSKVGMQQMETHADVPMKTKIPDLNPYDLIFLGYPTWGGQIPRIFNSLFAENDFSGKRVVPFSTSVSTPFEDTLPSFKEAAGDGVKIVGGFRYRDEAQVQRLLKDNKSSSSFFGLE